MIKNSWSLQNNFHKPRDTCCNNKNKHCTDIAELITSLIKLSTAFIELILLFVTNSDISMSPNIIQYLYAVLLNPCSIRIIKFFLLWIIKLILELIK